MSNNTLTETNLDLGYRWEAGELSDWEVLIELCEGSEAIACLMVEQETACDHDSWLAWKHAGQMFDWALGVGEPPYIMRRHVKSEEMKMKGLISTY